MKIGNPRHGSMQFWPRKRANRAVARVRSWSKKEGINGFLGYKVGMAHVMVKNINDKRGAIKSLPVTIIECPPLKIFSVRFYKNKKVLTEILNPKLNEDIKRKVTLPKKTIEIKEAEGYDSIRLLLYTQPKTAIGKKKPDVFEVHYGGDFAWVKDNLDKEISVNDVFKEKEQVDIHSITKGKGVQGVIKRFGVSLKAKKSEKGQRSVGARSGGWTSQAHMMYRVAQPGQMGYHKRTELNKSIMKISKEEITPKDGFKNYGNVKNSYLIIRGSVAGAKKRAITLVPALRPSNKIAKENFEILEVVA